MQLTKSDFVRYLLCPNSLWLHKHKPDLVPGREFSAFAQKLSDDGHIVEGEVCRLLDTCDDAASFEDQVIFESDRGLYARADFVRDNGDGSVDLFEVKSSTSVKQDAGHNHLKDATFQAICARETGLEVRNVFLVHLNKGYVRLGDIDPAALLVFADITDDVAAIEAETRAEIDAALDVIAQGSIDETRCSCLEKSRSNHCDAFVYFNPGVPDPSVHNLPRITSKKLAGFVAEGRLGLETIRPEEVTDKQALVVRAAQGGGPYIDRVSLAAFYARAKYPLWFLDYETYASAIPLVDGASPHFPIPFQYSLHVKRHPDDDQLLHVEYLAEEAALPLAMIEHMEAHIGPTGSVLSWHATFENTQNRVMAAAYPEKAGFLENLIERTLDLEELAKTGYVDIRFGGSTSIKKVLPVLAPDLSYEDMAVADGTGAMEAWTRLVGLPPGPEKDELREQMLEYCKLDTYAMVRIFEEIGRLL